MTNSAVSKIEMDELCIIVKKIMSRMKDYEDDGSWILVAFAPNCKLIITFILGPGKQYVADKLMSDPSMTN